MRPLIWATSIEDNDTIEEVEFFRRRPDSIKKPHQEPYADPSQVGKHRTIALSDFGKNMKGTSKSCEHEMMIGNRAFQLD